MEEGFTIFDFETASLCYYFSEVIEKNELNMLVPRRFMIERRLAGLMRTLSEHYFLWRFAEPDYARI